MNEALLSRLYGGHSAVLATIVSRQGSTPRTPGTRMAIFGDGANHAILGTIGGGRVEAEAMAAAPSVLAQGLARFIRFDLTNSDAAGMDMICGGRLEVLLEPLPSDAPTLEWLRAVRDAQAQGGQALNLTLLEPAAEAPDRFLTRRMLADVGAGGLRILAGGGALPEELLPRLAGCAAERCPVLLPLGGGFVVAESLRPAGVLWIFGAGHVSQKLAVLADFLGFRTAVLDDRAEFANRQRFPSAWSIQTPAEFDGLLARLGIAQRDMLVIVTRGHSHDMELLNQALRTPAAYVGMIGSRRKRDAVYAQLRQRGHGDADFARVRCPIGLDIGAETPEEIAVSIAAELIQARAGLGGA